MKIIDRYIAHAVISATLTVLFVLLVIFSFFTFIDELEEIGRGSYGLVQASMVVLLRSPGLAYELFPIAALIGSLLGLGGMMENNEISVVRCAGVSKFRIIWSVMKAGLVFVVIAVVIGELLLPSAERFAREYRSLALNDQISQRSENGYWARDGNSYINIRELLPNDRFNDIDIYEFDVDSRLRTATQAGSAHYKGGQWELRDIRQTSFQNGPVESRHIEKATWDSLLDPDLIGMVAINPDALSVVDLSRYVTFIRGSGQSAQRYEHALWVKMGYPIATAVMVFLAIPLVLRPTRTISMGRRIMIGAAIGLAFHIVNQASGHLGIVLNAPAVISAMGPTIVVFSVGVVLNYRTQ